MISPENIKNKNNTSALLHQQILKHVNQNQKWYQKYENKFTSLTNNNII